MLLELDQTGAIVSGSPALGDGLHFIGRVEASLDPADLATCSMRRPIPAGYPVRRRTVTGALRSPLNPLVAGIAIVS